jgi:LEA14-like dessication related protein
MIAEGDKSLNGIEMSAWRRRLCTAMLALALAACAAVLPKLEAPRLDVVAVEMGGATLQRADIRLRLHASNPNTRAIAVRGIECTLELAEHEFAQCASDAAFTLPPNGETEFTLNVTANMNVVLQALAENLGQNSIDYRLYGRVNLASGLLRSIPFDQRGRARLR